MKLGEKKTTDAVLAGAIVALALLLAWYAWEQFRPGVGILRINSLAAPNYLADSVAISADGTQVAMLHQETANGPGQFVVEVRNVQSGQQVSKLTMPPATEDRNTPYYTLSRRLSFCDGGKYLLAFADPDRLYVADTRTYTFRDPIHLSALRLRAEGNPGNPDPPPDTPIPSGPVEIDCAASSSVAVLGFSEGVGVAVIKVIDLVSGKDLVDLGGIYYPLFFKGLAHDYQGDGLAISPDGSKVAIGVWQAGEVGGFAVDVVDVKSPQLLKTVFLHDGFRNEHRIAFAGEGTVVIGEPECDSDVKCDLRSPPTDRKLRLWDFGTTGAVKRLGTLFHESYRTFGASADGNEVFAYTGDESYCGFCNSGHGELKVHNARFTVWDRASGNVLTLSPSLRVENHPCPWLVIMGSCDSSEQVPEMQMSANGKAILAFWPGADFPPEEGSNAVGNPEVYTLR
jgi:hypothetical protein